MDASSKTLIISDGSLASLIACGVAKETAAISGRTAAGTCVLPWPTADSSRALRERAARVQAEVFAYELIEPLRVGVQDMPSLIEQREVETASLLAAAQEGVRRGCDLVIWPLQCARSGHSEEGEGLDLDWIARAADKAVLVSRLISVDADAHGVPGIRIEAPYLDVPDHQLADLAAEMELPMRACWWWPITRRDGEAAIAERERWLRALALVGWTVPAA